MNRSEYVNKAAELGFLEKQAATPGISRLTLMSIQSRIDQARTFLGKWQACISTSEGKANLPRRSCLGDVRRAC